MGYKKMKKNLGFADFALASSLKHNRSLKLMEKLSIPSIGIESNTVLMNNYTVGTSGEGADAYPPLLLFKCMMLQKWFRINSDPELENQINDRLSFKKSLGLSFEQTLSGPLHFLTLPIQISKKLWIRSTPRSYVSSKLRG